MVGKPQKKSVVLVVKREHEKLKKYQRALEQMKELRRVQASVVPVVVKLSADTTV